MKKYFIIGLLSLLFFGGCQSVPQEIPIALDTDLDALEVRMHKARDPEGAFESAQTYVQRIVVHGGRHSYIMEVKFARPDKFRINTLLDNKPEKSLIMNGPAVWSVDFKERKVSSVTGDELERVKIMYALTNPEKSYRKYFAQIELSACRIEDAEYYKLRCHFRDPSLPPLDIFVSKNTDMISRMAALFRQDGKMIPYESHVSEYMISDGVYMPKKIKSTFGKTKQTSEVELSKFNANVDASEFMPPIF